MNTATAVQLKAEDLRIGNIGNTEYGMYSVVATMLVDIMNDGFVVEPVELTPEILEKCGFKEYWENAYELKRNGEDFLYVINGKVYISVDGEGLEVPMKYLHQLQNIYHSLTGEELSIAL